jgi:hypothetical protein
MRYIIIPAELHPAVPMPDRDEEVSFYFVGGRLKHWHSLSEARQAAIDASNKEGVPYAVFRLESCLMACDHREISLT